MNTVSIKRIPYLWRLLILFALCLSSCTDKFESTGNGTGDSEYLDLYFHWSDTRADISEDGSGTFTEGDKIGLIVSNGDDRQYRELTYTGGEWTPRLKRSEFGKGELTIAAHFPAFGTDAESSPDQKFSIAADQSNPEEGFSDILFAKSTLKENEYRADMTFRHIFHRLRINLTGTADNIEIAVRSRLNCTVNLLTGKSPLLPDAEIQWITPQKTSDGAYLAIICPQPATDYKDESGLIKLTGNGKEAIFKAPERLSDGSVLSSFEAGKQTEISLNVETGKPDLANKTLWVYGVNAPDFPGKENIPTFPPYTKVFPAGEWFRYNYTFSEEQHLTWKEGCNWFDCNKSENYDENDRNLCWAASASNLIIWWMVHNRPYIEAYDKEYGSSVTAGSITVQRPSDEFKPLYSNGTVNRAPVFEFFKAWFPDRGSWNSAGVNWFMNGNRKNLLASKLNDFPGFFHEVFQTTDNIATDSNRQPNREQFNDFMIDALLNKKAIGFNVYDIAGTGTGNHAMVIWGAEFDETGTVSHIYYCDNNKSDQDANGANIARVQVIYENNATYFKELDNEDGMIKKNYPITCLCSVDLRQDIWKQKYPNVIINE